MPVKFLKLVNIW